MAGIGPNDAVQPPRPVLPVDTTPSAQLPRIASFQRQDAATERLIRETLAHGVELGGRDPLIAGKNSAHAYTTTLVHPERSDFALRTVIKPIEAGGAQEHAVARVATAFGAGHLLAPTERRADGAAAIQHVPGDIFLVSDVYTPDAFASHSYGFYKSQHPELSDAQAARLARIDLQLAQKVDGVFENLDRNLYNGLRDAKVGMTLIDHGQILREGSGAYPTASSFFLPTDLQPVGKVGAQDLLALRLDPEVTARGVEANEDEIVAALEQLQRDTHGRDNIGRFAQPVPKDVVGLVTTRLRDASSGLLHFLRAAH